MEQQSKFGTTDILIFLWKKRKPILFVVLLAFVSSFIISFFIKEQFKAETTIFPTNFISPMTSLMQERTTQETDVLLIGDEDDLERMIQILGSNIILDKISAKYNLISHYGLNPDDPAINFKLNKIFHSNVSYKKTQYQAAGISVIDEDPQMAANIANDIAELVDSIIIDMQKEKLQQAYDLLNSTYNSELAVLRVLEDSLSFFRKKNLPVFIVEIERYTEAYTKGIVDKKMVGSTNDFFTNTFDSLAKYGARINTIERQLTSTNKNLLEVRVQLTKIKANIDNEITHKYTISYAKVPDKKFSPKKSVIIIGATLGAFVFIIVILLLLDLLNQTKKKFKEIT